MSYTNGLDKPTDYFNTKLYTGNNTSDHNITGVGFEPSFTWIKRRNSASDHMLYDSVRGVTKDLRSNQNNAESTDANGLSSFDSDGFTIETSGFLNSNNDTFVSWNWLAGGSASSNSDGSITSSVSANTTAGFSIVSYTATGSNATVGHGLGSAPQLVIIKDRDVIRDWIVGDTATGFDKYLLLNSTTASITASNRFQDTAPSSSVVTIGTHGYVNNNGSDYIAYCFAQKKGYSKIGSYTGNGSASSGPFVYLGFRPAWVMIKRSSGTGGWEIYDSKRDGFNPQVHGLTANTSNAEDNTDDLLDLLSNGFKLYHDGSGLNTNGSEYIYMAFAESPFVNSKGVPNNAK